MHVLDYVDTATVVAVLLFIIKRLSALQRDIDRLGGKVEIILIWLQEDKGEREDEGEEKEKRGKSKLGFTTLAALYERRKNAGS